jgi:hypothetical protein
MDLRNQLTPESPKTDSIDDQVAAFVREIARLTKDGELVDGQEFEMENDDAVDILNSLISQAWQLLGQNPDRHEQDPGQDPTGYHVKDLGNGHFVLLDPDGLEVSSTSDANGLTGRCFTRAELEQAARTYNEDARAATSG